ncbi:hypothetical protein ACFY40_11380 [Streptomyces sp. NPDC012950]|uniref:hypothetical protein n=1 Tax=Streptomyces sp. NPDC012950 TaxID=3364858 RepID=UPI0036A869A6
MSAADRRAILRRTARDYKGPLTTGMVVQLYKAHGLNVPSRKTARDDLAYLARQGLLVERGPENGRHYTLNHWNGAAL